MAAKRYTKVDLDGDLRVAVEHHAARLGMKVAEYLKHLAAVATGAGMGPVSGPNGARMGPEPGTGEGDDESPRVPDGAETGPERAPNGPRGGGIGGESVDVDSPPLPIPTEQEQQGGAGGRRAAETWRDVEVPEALRCESFDGLWLEWGRHRREKGQRLTPTAARRQLKKLEGIGVERAILALNSSIANGYTGVFEPNFSIPPSGSRPGASARRAGYNPLDADDLESTVIRSGGGHG